MTDLLVREPWLRLSVFAAVFLALAAWELLAPRRRLTVGKPYRWTNNLGIVVIDTLLVRALFPIAAVGTALMAEQAGWGMLNVLAVPGVWAILLGIVLMDLLIWAQHVAFHAVPMLWRLHRMHHADLDFDVTTGLRFHPLEVVLSMLIKIAIVIAFGIPAVAVLIFELLLNASSMFNHGNVRIPGKLDSTLRWLLVTPDMHRVHHSWHAAEMNSNFGFTLACWDRIFRTYRRDPRDGQDHMQIGLQQFREPLDLRLDRMLLQPFTDSK